MKKRNELLSVSKSLKKHGIDSFYNGVMVRIKIFKRPVTVEFSYDNARMSKWVDRVKVYTYYNFNDYLDAETMTKVKEAVRRVMDMVERDVGHRVFAERMDMTVTKYDFFDRNYATT